MLQRPIHAYHEPTGAFALAGGTRSINLWRVEDSAKIASCEEIRRPRAGRVPLIEFHVQNDSLRGLFFENATTLVGVHASGLVLAWRVDWDGGQLVDKPVWSLDLHVTITAFEVRPAQDGLAWRVAVGGENGRVFVLDAATSVGEAPVVSVGHAHTEAVVSLAFHGDRVASGARDRLVHVWVMPAGERAGEFGVIGTPSEVEEALARAASDPLSAASKSLTHLVALDGCQGWPLALSFSNKGTKLAAGCMDNGLYCWALSDDFFDVSPTCVMSFVHDGWVSDVAFSPDDSVLATACWDHSVGLFNAESLVLRHLFQQHRDYAVKVLFVPGRDVVLSASYDQTIAVWDWKNFRSLEVLVGQRDWVGDLVLLSDGLVASVTSDHSACVWSTHDWRMVEILGHSLYGDMAPFDEDTLNAFMISDSQFEAADLDNPVSFGVDISQFRSAESTAAVVVSEPIEEFTEPRTVEALIESKAKQTTQESLAVDVIDLILDAFSEPEDSEPMFMTPASSPFVVDAISDALYNSLDERSEGRPPEELTAEKFQSIFEALSDVEPLLVGPGHVGPGYLGLEHVEPERVGHGSAEPSGLLQLPSFFVDEHSAHNAPMRLEPGPLGMQKGFGVGDVPTLAFRVHHLDEDLSVPEPDLSGPHMQAPKNRVVETGLQNILNDAAWHAPGMGIMKRRSGVEHQDYQPFLQIKTPHRNDVHVGLSVLEERIITGGGGDEVCVWHSRGHLETRFCVPSNGGVHGVGFLAGGRVAYGLGTDSRVHLWLLPRTMLGRPGITQHAILDGHEGSLTSAAMHSSGRVLVTGSQDMTARLWCMKSGNCLSVLTAHAGAVKGVVFGTRGPVTVGDDGLVNFWDMHGVLIDQLEMGVALLGIDSLGGELSYAAASGAVYKMREGGTRPRRLVGHYGQARSVSFRADGAMVTGGEDGRVFVYEEGGETPVQEILLPDSICEVRLSEGMLMAACEGGTVYLFRRSFQ